MTFGQQASTPPHHRMRRGVSAGLVLAALLVLVVSYVRIGWDRMETACTADGPGEAEASSVQFTWSWWPPGFTCAYDDGRTETSLWF